MAENLITLIPPYAIFEVGDVIENRDYDVFFSLSYGEAIAAAKYLTNMGFAVWRNDLGANNVIIQLTDRGRKLKELGSVAEFNLVETMERSRMSLQKRRDEYLFWVVVLTMTASLMQGMSSLFEIIRNYYNPFFLLWIWISPLLLIVFLFLGYRMIKSQKQKWK